MGVEELDRLILSILARNSRESIRKIASYLHMPHTTIYSRLKRLESMGVIERYTILPNYEKLGYTVTAIINVSVEGAYIEELEELCSKRKEVLAVYDVTGEYDMTLIAKFRSISELDSFIKWLNKIRGVKKTLTSVAFKVVKYDPTSPLC